MRAEMNFRIRVAAAVLILIPGFFCLSSLAGTVPPDVLAQLTNYNLTWTSTSTNGSPGSTPIGNGDITANVWVENNGGDLMMYMGKSDSWSEGTRLLKIGRTRIHFSPNPFTVGAPFSQTLDFYHGEIDITAGQSGSQVNLRIWIDANQPVLRVEANGQQNFTMSCSNEVWRSASYTPTNGTPDPPSGGWRGVNTGWTESADVVLSLSDRLVSYHRNTSSLYQTILTGENLNGYWTTYPDPYTNRTFGATFKAVGFSKVNDYTLQSTSGTNFAVSIYAYTAQTTAATDWQNQMSNVVSQVDATDLGTARTNHYNWWDAFWNRSWIFITGDSNATIVTQGYLEHRFMEACQGRGSAPIKFNGGTFTFDYNGQNGDYREWGPGYWNQNTRLLYWPLLASGDFDLMQPWFNSYTNMLGLQMAATTKYYGHGGAFFPETYNFFGLYELTDWGSSSTATYAGNTFIKYHYQGALETLSMMLSYYDYTQDNAFATNCIVPFATQVIRFFNQHWPKVNGKLFFYPANACEMYWSCTNSTDYISGLMSDIPRLVALPTNFTTPALLNEWTNCYSALPPLPMNSGGSYVIPAQTYGATHNAENPECYCIFPYRLFGLGLSNFNVGLATFNNRTIKNYKNDWSQDVIEEPLVGLTSSAQADVISNFSDKDNQCRFPAFWTSRSDYLPCEDTGGAAMSGLQYMLMQCVGNKILLLPAWPTAWNVDFKLCAPSNTTVRLVLTNGAITQLTVTPSTRSNDLVEATAPAPASLTATAGNGRAGLTWTASTGAGGYNVKRATVSGGPYTPIASGVSGLSYLDSGLLNGTNYYYVVSATNLWGEGANSIEVSVTPTANVGVQWEGDLIANVQSSDLNSSSKVWTNRTSNPNSVGNFSTVGGGNLNVANVAYGSGTVRTLFVNQIGNNSVQSALNVPTEIISNGPVSVEAWIYPVTVTATSCYLNYGYQGGSSSPMNEREFDYDTSGHGVISGDFGPLDTAWTTTPTANAWHYVAVTYDGMTLKAYLDGNLDVSRAIGTSIATVRTFMQVGSAIGGTGVNGGNDPFHGYIASARAESGVLTAGDIVNNYVMGPTGTATAIIPSGLTGKSGDGLAVLTWNACANASIYNVKSSTASNGPFTLVASNVNGLSFTNTGLSNGTVYYFVISATNSVGESANSSAVSVQPVSTTVPMLQPSISSGQLQLAWPPDHTGWLLQAQTNPPNTGLGTHWVTVPASSGTDQMAFPMDPTNGSVFFRLYLSQ
jgi:alpha-L-fucosidase 2